MVNEQARFHVSSAASSRPMSETAFSADTGRIKYRKLRIAFSAMCGIFCLLLIALWVRSYVWADHLIGPRPGVGHLGISSSRGWLTMRWDHGEMSPTAFPRWTLQCMKNKEVDKFYDDMAAQGLTFTRPTFSFGYHGGYLQLPYWPIVLSLAITSAVLTFRGGRCWRFSLRTLLIGMTLVAAILGAVAWAAK
jgi:hypothetical protein